jgi:acetyltransferase-like isoleucine patch superfamily enzyme
MIYFLKDLATKARVYLMRRQQFDSLALREHFRTNHRIEVGLYSYGCFDQWRMPGPIQVGRYCSIANTVRSAPINHPTEALTTHPILYERKFGVVDEDITWDTPLIIEDGAWIAHNVVILPSCKFIGRGAIVGAGAILTKDVDRYAIVAGNPARKLRDRFEPALVDAIEATRWWELDPPALRNLVKARPEMFFSPSLENLADWPGADNRGRM